MLFFRPYSRDNLIKIYTKTHQNAQHFYHIRATIINMYFYMKIVIVYSRLFQDTHPKPAIIRL